MDPATQIDLGPLAAQRGLAPLVPLLSGRLAPRRASLHGPWPTDLPALLTAARTRRFDPDGARLLLDLLGPLERGLAAYDLLTQSLFTDEERPLVDRLRFEASRVAPLLPEGRWPLSKAAMTLPTTELRRLIVALAEGTPSDTNPLAIAPMLAAMDAIETRELLGESMRIGAIELHYAHLSTWASVVLAVLARLGGHRRAVVDLIEVAGSMPRLGGAFEPIEALIGETGQPEAVRSYFAGRLFGYAAPESLRSSTLAGLRSALGTLENDVDLDTAPSLCGPEAISLAAPLTDQEALDLATVALAHQELLAGLGVRPITQLLDVSTRRPTWRFGTRVRLSHLVARAPSETDLIVKEEAVFYRLFGPHYPSLQSWVRLLQVGSDAWKWSQLKALEQVQWNLSSEGAWMTLGFHLMTRQGSDDDRQALVNARFDAIDRQLEGIARAPLAPPLLH